VSGGPAATGPSGGSSGAPALEIKDLGITFQPEAVVRFSGGPSPSWSALKAGSELQQLVADWPDRVAAQRNPAVVDAVAAYVGAVAAMAVFR